MAPPGKTVFVLWGDSCDELVAVTFVTVLRTANILVKLVGLSGRQVRGAHGLALTPDYTLSQVSPLAHQAACVIIPCSAASLVRFISDPRLGAFLQQAYAHQARFFLQDLGVFDFLIDVGVLPIGAAQQISIYPHIEALLSFVADMSLRFV